MVGVGDRMEEDKVNVSGDAEGANRVGMGCDDSMDDLRRSV